MKIIYVIINKQTNVIEKAYDDLHEAIKYIVKDKNNYVYERVALEEKANRSVEMKSIKDVDKKSYDPLHFNDAMPYGKYKGQTVGSIIQSDPEYLQWCQNNVSLSLDEDCCELLGASLEK